MHHRRSSGDRERERERERHKRVREKDSDGGHTYDTERRDGRTRGDYRTHHRDRDRERPRERERHDWHSSSRTSRGSKRRRRHRYEEEERNRSARHRHRGEHRDSPTYTSRSRSSPRYDADDDRHGHLNVKLGESITPRYKALEIIGEGTFGKVVCCWDREKKKRVALKVIRAIEKYREAAMIEIEILEKLLEHDAEGRDYKGHVVMVFDRYGLSLYDFLKKNDYHPFTIETVADIGYQLLKAISFIHDLTLIHTDLKPENILFTHSEYNKVPLPHSGCNDTSEEAPPMVRVPASSDIKLIDFGSATFDSHHHTRVVSTRHYRAPEVILGLGWTYPADMWSVGCILLELYNGNALFITHDNVEHLAMMERSIGPLPLSMTKRASKKAKNFFRDGILRWPELIDRVSHGNKYVDRMEELKELVKDDDFYDLLNRMLEYQPEHRITAKASLSHPFFDRVRNKYERANPPCTLESANGNSSKEKERPHHRTSHRHTEKPRGSSGEGSSSPMRKRSRIDENGKE